MAVRIANHYIRTPYLMLGAIDFSLLIVSVYTGDYLFHLWVLSHPATVSIARLGQDTYSLLPRALSFSLVMILCMGATGLYQPHKPEGINGVILRILVSYAMAAASLTLVFFIFRPLTLARSAFLLADILSFISLVILRFMFLRTVDDDILKRRILIYGAGERALGIFNTLSRQTDQAGFKIVGFLHVDGEEDAIEGEKITIDPDLIASYARDHEIEEILIVMNDRRGKIPLAPLLECRLSGINVISSMEFLERETRKINLEFLQGGWLVYTPGFIQGITGRTIKRTLDILVSLVILLMTWPLMLMTCLAITLESGFGQPILYQQTRVGLHNNHFMIYKFRSMTTDAERGNQPQWAQVNDSRVTKVGAILRKYRIDELPQLFNVLRGDMSLVGPRPERPEFTLQLEQVLSYYAVRHSVKPGLAGWAQLNYPYGSSVKDAYEKLQYDLYYAKNHSLFLDFIILLQTIEVVLWSKGAR